jgi:hypothetical protein
MKWILVWWVIHPHYMEIKYLRDLPSASACYEEAQQLASSKYKINFHCGME